MLVRYHGWSAHNFKSHIGSVVASCNHLLRQKRFHSKKNGVSTEMLRFPGEPCESERAGALDCNLPRQALSQQGAPVSDRGQQTGELELTSRQVGAQARLQPSLRQGGQGRGTIRRAESRQDRSGAEPGSTRAAPSVLTQLAERRRALLPE